MPFPHKTHMHNDRLLLDTLVLLCTRKLPYKAHEHRTRNECEFAAENVINDSEETIKKPTYKRGKRKLARNNTNKA